MIVNGQPMAGYLDIGLIDTMGDMFIETVGAVAYAVLFALDRGRHAAITRTADALYIHKNTLQQHLRKIAARTGYDPRSLRSSAVFYVVLYFYQDIHLAGFPT